MRVRFTILICALLVLGLAVSQVNAQGYKVSMRTNNVVMGGNNQELGAIRLTYKTADQGGFNIVSNDTIEITFGDLTITNADFVTDTEKLTVLLEDPNPAATTYRHRGGVSYVTWPKMMKTPMSGQLRSISLGLTLDELAVKSSL